MVKGTYTIIVKIAKKFKISNPILILDEALKTGK